jgi:hypothetical protein
MLGIGCPDRHALLTVTRLISPRERVRCVPGMLISSEVNSSTQPDGGEGLVMRKGYRREAGSEGSAKQRCEPTDKNRIQGASAGRAGNVSRSPYPSGREA